MSGMEGTLDEEQIINIVATHPAERSGRFVLTNEHARSCLDGLGMWVIEVLQKLGVDAVCHLVVFVAKLFIEAADGIDNIVCESNDSNESSHDEVLSPVLPAELARVDMRSFVRTLRTKRARLKRKYSDVTIEEIIQKFGNSLRAYQEEEQLKAAVIRCGIEKKGSSERWAVLNMRFPLLQDFCGGLATAFLNTVTVKSNLSVISGELNDFKV